MYTEQTTVRDGIDTVGAIMKCLMNYEIKLNFADILSYTAMGVTILIVLLILLPTYMISCMLLIILFIIFAMYIVYRTSGIRRFSNIQNDGNKKISLDKLKKFRAKLQQFEPEELSSSTTPPSSGKNHHRNIYVVTESLSRRNLKNNGNDIDSNSDGFDRE